MKASEHKFVEILNSNVKMLGLFLVSFSASLLKEKKKKKRKRGE